MPAARHTVPQYLDHYHDHFHDQHDDDRARHNDDSARHDDHLQHYRQYDHHHLYNHYNDTIRVAQPSIPRADPLAARLGDGIPGAPTAEPQVASPVERRRTRLPPFHPGVTRRPESRRGRHTGAIGMIASVSDQLVSAGVDR
jgi:hypothetical protein